MPEWSALICPLALVYGSVALGTAAGWALSRWNRRGGRTLTLRAAGWVVTLPVLAALTLPWLHPVHLEFVGPFALFHDAWHTWEAALHTSPVGHALLHLGNGLLLLVAGASLARGLWFLECLLCFHRRLGRLRRDAGQEDRVVLIPTARPLCFTAGLVRPVVYLTTGLRDQLSEPERAAVLAHEAAHGQRRDTLSYALLTLFSIVFPVPGAARLLAEWQGAVEQECDREAARVVGNGCDVAAALIRVARLVNAHGERVPVGTCFSGDGRDVEARVQRLLSPKPPQPEPPGFLVAVGASLGGLAAAGLVLQHLVVLFGHH